MDTFYTSSKFLRSYFGLASTVWKGFSAMANENKYPRLMKYIGTHNGTFHCDEALACFMFKQLPEYEDAEIIRTRDENTLAKCDVVLDVGSVYDHKKHRYDHHQKTFEHTLSTLRPELAKNKTIKLSSAGLVYAHFGFEVIKQILQKENCKFSDEELNCLFLYVYDDFVEEIDAIDNGVPLCGDGKQKYRINTTLSARVNRLNPKWNNTKVLNVDKLFKKAVDLAGCEFKECVLEAATVWWPAREIVRKSVENRKSIDESGDVILLEECCPWRNHLFAIEKETGIEGEIKFCIFADSNGSWRVQAVPVQPESFVCRVFLHKDWRGLRDNQLSTISNIPGCIFCHSTGFIGGNVTKMGAIQMALKSLRASLADKE